MNFCVFTGWCHGILIISEAKQRPGCGASDRVPQPQDGFLLIQPKFGKTYSRACLHCGGWTLVFNWTTSVFQLNSAGRFMFPWHLWGRRLFDRVKGSPSIRPRVHILALGRFPIDYLTTQKHSTSLDRPTHTQPSHSWPSAHLAFWVWPCLQHTAT